MASMFGSPVVPPGLYSTLKLCLLLSLVQTRENEQDSRHFLDVLALSSDTLIIDRCSHQHHQIKSINLVLKVH